MSEYPDPPRTSPTIRPTIWVVLGGHQPNPWINTGCNRSSQTRTHSTVDGELKTPCYSRHRNRLSSGRHVVAGRNPVVHAGDRRLGSWAIVMTCTWGGKILWVRMSYTSASGSALASASTNTW